MDKGPLTGVRHDLVEIELVDDHNTSAELGFGMLRVFATEQHLLDATPWARRHGSDYGGPRWQWPGRRHVNFGAPGLWVYRNNAVWSQLHGLSPARVAAGDIDGSGRADLVLDFGSGIGLWTFRHNTTWVTLNGVSAEAIVLADRDGTGQAEIVIDFGPTLGLWQYANDSAWSQLHRLSPQAMRAGAFH